MTAKQQKLIENYVRTKVRSMLKEGDNESEAIAIVYRLLKTKSLQMSDTAIDVLSAEIIGALARRGWIQI